jgi:hypothetical protein
MRRPPPGAADAIANPPPAVLDAERFNIPKKAISAATWSLGGCDPSRIQSRSKPIKALVEFPAGPKNGF